MRPLKFDNTQIRLIAVLVPCVLSLTALADDRDIVINEVMYHPPNDLENLQYVELFNRGYTAVDLSNWSFTKGIKFTFPPKTQIAPGAYAVVCRSVADFTTKYGKLPDIFGNFSGKLSHAGDRIELADAKQNVIDWVKYSDTAPWPIGADGYSASLERIFPHAPGQGAENWPPSRLPAVQAPGDPPGN